MSTARLKAVRGIVSGAFSKIKVLSKESAFFSSFADLHFLAVENPARAASA